SVIRLDPERSKTRTGRLLPLSEPLKEVLKRRVAARRLDKPLVFHRDGEPLIDWRKAWEAACKAAGLLGKHLHDCRAHGSTKLHPKRYSGTRRDAAHRPQDALGF